MYYKLVKVGLIFGESSFQNRPLTKLCVMFLTRFLFCVFSLSEGLDFPSKRDFVQLWLFRGRIVIIST